MKIVKIIIATLSSLIGFFALYLLGVAIWPRFPQPRKPLGISRSLASLANGEPQPSRQDVEFRVRGSAIRAWLYWPTPQERPVPCIVMANGLGGTRAGILTRYAARFQSAGFAVLVFDYRYWGDSEGQPRGLIWIPSQLEDYAAAIAYARSLPAVDPERIAVWGTSFSGGHVFVQAAEDHGLACVVAQCPGLDGREAVLMSYKRTGFDLRLIVHAQRDLARSWLGLSPHMIPVVGNPGDIALMPNADALEAFEGWSPPGYENLACARIAIRADKYRPVTQAANIRCPVLFLLCDEDELIPNHVVEETAIQLGELADVKHYPCGHFDIYGGEFFEMSMRDQISFLRTHLQDGTYA